MKTIIFFILVTASISCNAEWAAVINQVGKGKWNTQNGIADVTIKNNDIEISIYSADRKLKIYEINGRIKNSEIKAKRTTLNSDVPKEEITGDFLSFDIGTSTYEVIKLQNDFSFVGLTKASALKNDKTIR